MSSAVVIKTLDYDDPYVVFGIEDDEEVKTEIDERNNLLVTVVQGGDRFTVRVVVRFASGRWDFVYVTDDVESDAIVGGQV